MRLFRSVRWLLMTLLLSLIPASSYAGVFISVGFAPPALPVYVQPPCPQPGLMWTPGYWAYGPDGYYWVPGAWVPAPYVGALWTPGYWGWGGGLYVWHPGYWGPHVGYYGGVNYGFGYMGIGFAGGAWRGGMFAYNTAVVRVNNVYVHNTYVDNTVVRNTTIVNNSHVAYNGGPGGINHAPTAEERTAMNERHLAPTSYQAQHMNSAMADRNAYFKNNGGRPQNAAFARPLAAESHPAPSFNNNRPSQEFNRGGGNSLGAQPQYRAPQNTNRPTSGYQTPRNNNQYRPAPQNQPRYEGRPQAHPQGHPERDNRRGR